MSTGMTGSDLCVQLVGLEFKCAYESSGDSVKMQSLLLESAFLTSSEVILWRPGLICGPHLERQGCQRFQVGSIPGREHRGERGCGESDTHKLGVFGEVGSEAVVAGKYERCETGMS